MEFSKEQALKLINIVGGHTSRRELDCFLATLNEMVSVNMDGLGSQPVPPDKWVSLRLSIVPSCDKHHHYAPLHTTPYDSIVVGLGNINSYQFSQMLLAELNTLLTRTGLLPDGLD